MSNPLSTSSSDAVGSDPAVSDAAGSNPAVSDPVRERGVLSRSWATLVMIAFLGVVNVAVDRHYAYEQRVGRKPYGSYSSTYISDAANRDPYPVKVLSLGNSVHQNLLRFRVFRRQLQELVGEEVELYNLGILGSSPLDYGVLLSQLELGPSTVVILPLADMTFRQDWPLFRTDLSGLIAKPSVIEALGADFYRRHTDGEELSSSLLKVLFPVARQAYLAKLDIQQEILPEVEQPILRVLLNGISESAAGRKGENLVRQEMIKARERAESNGKPPGSEDQGAKVDLYLDQLDRLLESLNRRHVPTLAYLMPINHSHRVDSADLMAEVGEMLDRHTVPWLDLRALHSNADFMDSIHTPSDDQFLALTGAIQMAEAQSVQQIESPAPAFLSRLELAGGGSWNLLEVTLSQPVAESQITRVHIIGRQLVPLGSEKSSKAGAWMFREGNLYLATPLSIEMARASLRVTIATEGEPNGPLLELIRAAKGSAG